MRLSIMVTTMPSRASKLEALVHSFGMSDAQYKEFPHALGTMRTWTAWGVEILAYMTEPYDDRTPGLTFGGKRNAILEIAQGRFVLSFDDDDQPHPEFLARILKVIDANPDTDVIGYKVACYGYAQTNGQFDPSIMEPADVSIRYKDWANDQNGFKYEIGRAHV